jgi:hypothetical protein
VKWFEGMISRMRIAGVVLSSSVYDRAWLEAIVTRLCLDTRSATAVLNM